MTVRVRPKDLKLPEYMTRGGPGDLSMPGNVNTTEWWRPEHMSELGKKKAAEKGSIVEQAKSKEIYFCGIPFTQLYNEIDGRYQACCFAEADKISTIKNTSLKDWMNKSAYMNVLREEMTTPGSDLKFVKKFCKRCVTDEEKYGRSRRTNCLKIHTNNSVFWDDIEHITDRFRKTGEYKLDRRVLEIQLKIYGSECNLDCFMCLHANSTTRMKVAESGVWNQKVWTEENAGIQIQESNELKSKYKLVGPKLKKVLEDNTPGSIEQILELAPYTRSIKIIGGEPLIMKRQYEMLQALIDTGDSKEIIIKFQTNMTKMARGKHNIFKFIPHFKLVTMVASVDGIGKTIEYMRRRTDWPELVDNIEQVKKYPNAVVDFNGLVSFLSVMRFYEVVDWCKDNPVIDQINWAMLENPKHFAVHNLPKKLKLELIIKYSKFPDIVAALEKENDSDVNIQDTFQYFLQQDRYYVGTKWESHLFDVFPELKEFYDPNYVSPDELDKRMQTELKKGIEKVYEEDLLT
tara:strand:- start:429 stop:1979 length:1551 start_codon:yes stop_codon:yes gene_type:complete